VIIPAFGHGAEKEVRELPRVLLGEPLFKSV